jgi:pyrroloquinoline quinone biosynthesis protein D
MHIEEKIALTSRVYIDPMYLFRWEEQEQAYLLLYPEGIVKLNNSAGHILKHCDGERCVDQVIDELEREFDQKGLGKDILKFMEVAHAKGWIRLET